MQFSYMAIPWGETNGKHYVDTAVPDGQVLVLLVCLVGLFDKLTLATVLSAYIKDPSII